MTRPLSGNGDLLPSKAEGLPPYSLTTTLLIWASVSLPMLVLAWVIAPLLIPHSPLPAGMTYWLLMIAGMIWEFVMSIVLLTLEGQQWTWPALKQRLWLNAPRYPQTGQSKTALWWWLVHCLLFSFLASQVLGGPLDQFTTALFPLPTYADIHTLDDPQFVGQWWIMGVALLSSVFNYFLGEELLFRGVLLPRMPAVFGRWDWLANAVLFGLYHLHKPWALPSIILSNLAISWPARQFRSNWLAVAVHGVEGLVLLVMVTLALSR